MWRAEVTGVHAGVTTVCPDRESVSRHAVADFAVSADRCGGPASVSVRLRPSSGAKRRVRRSLGGSTAHLLGRPVTRTSLL